MTEFDLKVHHMDEKGRVSRSTPYIRHASRDKGVIYERDGKFYFENDGQNEVPAELNWVATKAAPAVAKTIEKK